MKLTHSIPLNEEITIEIYDDCNVCVRVFDSERWLFNGLVATHHDEYVLAPECMTILEELLDDDD